MAYFYSPTTSGFYVDEIHKKMPEDVVAVTDAEYRYLMEGQALGKIIVWKSRRVQLADFVPPAVSWEDIRAKRDTILTKCDWTQMPDNQLDAETKETWLVYRQALRNITETFAHPDEVVWPLAPDSPTPTEE
jgi:hypothetical protein